MKLSKRLLSLANLIPKGMVVADVGSDHGLLLLYLDQHNLIKKGYGVENKVGPYSRLERALKNSENLSPVLSDGLLNLNEDVNCLILAGLGGETIIQIIKQGEQYLKNIEYIITDAHTSIPLVRKYLSNKNYRIIKEKLIYEKGTFYELSLFQKTNKKINYSKLEYEYGPFIIKEPLFQKLIIVQVKKIDQLLLNDLPLKRRNSLLTKRKELLHYANDNTLTQIS